MKRETKEMPRGTGVLKEIKRENEAKGEQTMAKKEVVFGIDEKFNLPDSLREKIKEEFTDVFHFVEVNGDGELGRLADPDVFIGWPSDKMLRVMPNLHWLQLPSAGANHYSDHPLLADHVVITNASGVYGVSGAEHILALILAFARGLPVHIGQTAKHIWQPYERPVLIEGATVGIIGLGDIGSEAAVRLKAFGAHVIGVRRHVHDKPDFVDALYEMDEMNQVLGKSDFVVNVLPQTDETEGLFDSERLSCMKPGAFFINVGRGQTVDERALALALRNGRLGGAGLDVTYEEPLPKTSELWDLPNIVITSHSLGLSPERLEKLAALISRNLRNYQDGKPLVNVVNRKLGY